MLNFFKPANFLVIALLTAFTAMSFNIGHSNAQSIDEVKLLLRNAQNGDGDALDKAFEMLEQLDAEKPNNAKVFAYFGSAFAIRVGETWNPLKKSEYGNRSFQYLDMALEMAPDDFDVRKNRAIVNMNAPFFMGRKDAGIEDLIVLDRLFQESPTPEVAKDMLHFKFYDFLIEEIPDRGNWTEGKALAEKLTQ